MHLLLFNTTRVHDILHIILPYIIWHISVQLSYFPWNLRRCIDMIRRLKLKKISVHFNTSPKDHTWSLYNFRRCCIYFTSKWLPGAQGVVLKWFSPNPVEGWSSTFSPSQAEGWTQREEMVWITPTAHHHKHVVCIRIGDRRRKAVCKQKHQWYPNNAESTQVASQDMIHNLKRFAGVRCFEK